MLLRLFLPCRTTVASPVHRPVHGTGTLPVWVQGRSALLAEGEIPILQQFYAD